MVNTKTTPRKRQDWRCHFCNKDCQTEVEWEAHTVKCGKEKRAKEQYQCTENGCYYATARKQDLSRHQKRVHGKGKTDESDWETQNPGNLSDLLETSVESSLVRKPTRPIPVVTTKRKQELVDMLKSSLQPQKIPRVSSTLTAPPVTHVSDSPGYESDDSTKSQPAVTGTAKEACTTSSTTNLSRTTWAFSAPRTCSVPWLLSPVITASTPVMSTTIARPLVKKTVEVGTQTEQKSHHHHLRRKRHFLDKDGVLISETEDEDWDDF